MAHTKKIVVFLSLVKIILMDYNINDDKILIELR